jgi:hypothetical protein
MHALSQAPPERLFRWLHQKSVLIIGRPFPSWLMRSFIRLLRGDRLVQSRGPIVFIVGEREDLALSTFLRTFKTRAEVFSDNSAIGFVDELHARWRQRVPTRAIATAQSLPSPGSIFISYAAEDRAAAEAVARSLAAANLDVWYDPSQSMAGDDLRDRIQAGIRRSDLFIPLLSRHCLALGERYYRREWTCAFEKMAGLPPSVQFIFPVVIDDLPYEHSALPSELTKLSWYSIADGVTPDFVARVKERYRLNQVD